MHLVLFGHHPYVRYYIEAQTIFHFYNTSGIVATREREKEREREGENRFIRVREIGSFSRSGILCCVKENECLLICQRNVREFYNFQSVSNDENQKMSRAVNNVKGPTSYYIYLSSFTPKPLRRV